ncbi:MAG: ribonuclease H [Thermodesulfobacteriota bacterium]|nr:ribonuclease H [Thermodesulfobacteriota bacterium]
MTNDDKKSWKRMSFKGNKVWVEIDNDGKFPIKNGKVLIKYNLKQDYEYYIKKENLKPEKNAVPKKSAKLTQSNKKKSADKASSGKASSGKTFSGKTESLDKTVPENSIIIYTDGASSGNPGPSGIGVFLSFGKHEKEISEFIGNSTNNIAELKAIKRALLELKRDDLPVRIYTDSSYSLGLLTKGWKPKKNIELVESIKKLIKGFNDLDIIKVKGHAGIEGNERADSLATAAIKK